MKLDFWKMHGAGNDFIIINAIESYCPHLTSEFIRSVCTRKTGAGAEGLIITHPPRQAGHFRMQFFNPDGREAEMCGNGARCIAALAHHSGVAPPLMNMETASGLVTAEVIAPDQVCLTLPPPCNMIPSITLEMPQGDKIEVFSVNTGVPHAIIMTQDINTPPIPDWGPSVRHHPAFAPQGTNANLLAPTDDPDTFNIRTFERGVEAETLACGTGMAAAAFAIAHQRQCRTSLALRTTHHDELHVEIPDPITPGHIRLTGPIAYVYQGTIDITGDPQ